MTPTTRNAMAWERCAARRAATIATGRGEPIRAPQRQHRSTLPPALAENRELHKCASNRYVEGGGLATKAAYHQHENTYMLTLRICVMAPAPKDFTHRDRCSTLSSYWAQVTSQPAPRSMYEKHNLPERPEDSSATAPRIIAMAPRENGTASVLRRFTCEEAAGVSPRKCPSLGN